MWWRRLSEHGSVVLAWLKDQHGSTGRTVLGHRLSPCRKRSPAKRSLAKSDEKRDRSVSKSDRKVTKSDRTPVADLFLLGFG